MTKKEKTKKVIEDMFWAILDDIIEETRLAKWQGYSSICYSPCIDSPYDYMIEGDLFENFSKSREERTRKEFEVLVDFVIGIVRKELDDAIKPKNVEVRL